MTLKVFACTAFGGFDEPPELISLGLVAEDGRERYLEIVGPHLDIPDFVMEDDLGQLGLMPEQVETHPELGRALGSFLLGLLNSEDTDTRLELVYEYPLVIELVQSALQAAELWTTIKSRLIHSESNFRKDEPEYRQGQNESWEASFHADGISQHHALAAARALCAAFNEMRHWNFHAFGLLCEDAEDVGWWDHKVQSRVCQLENAHKDAAAPPGAPIVFLDLDVVALCVPYGLRDAIVAVLGERPDAEQVLNRLFHPPAVEVLRRMHEAFGGHVRYVTTAIWGLYAKRAGIAEILCRSGLDFVAANLEDQERWSTRKWSFEGELRVDEVAGWLREHGRCEPFVVLDDSMSGRSLLRAGSDGASTFCGRVVICDEGVGLLPHHVDIIVGALRTPRARRTRLKR